MHFQHVFILISDNIPKLCFLDFFPVVIIKYNLKIHGINHSFPGCFYIQDMEKKS